MEHRILALVFHEFEALDLFGPLGAIVPRSDYYTLQLVNIHNLPAPQGLECSIKNSIGVTPNLSIADALEDTKPFDTLFIPGGLSMISLLDDPMLLKKIGWLVDRAPNVFTVCTGSLILAATGRLNGREATCNKRIYDEMTPKCRYHNRPAKTTYIKLKVFRSRCQLEKTSSLGGGWQVPDIVRHYGWNRCRLRFPHEDLPCS